jgi:hypothetical protein
MSFVARNALVALALVAPSAAYASSEEAWEKFAKEVEQKCTDAASAAFRKPQVAVDPKGSESFGIAIVYGKLKEGKDRAALVCVVDKKTGKVELGTELTQDMVRVRKPKADDKDDSKDDDQ